MWVYSYGSMLLTVIFSITIMITAANKDKKKCECGKIGKVENRIINGSNTAPHLYPWMVAILRKKKLHCGGSIINNKYVLTAGHCLKWNDKKTLTVFMGYHDRIAMENGKEKGDEIESTIVHESFTSYKMYDVNDIGLIKLKNTIEYSDKIKPVCLAKSGSQYTNKKSMVTGWGKTAQNGKLSQYLRKAGVKIIHQKECKNTAVGAYLADTMLCASETGHDACQGDSGGPLLFEKSPGQVEQIGIVSWGIGCAKPGVPGVYTRVTEYVDWIQMHTKDAEYCSE